MDVQQLFYNLVAVLTNAVQPYISANFDFVNIILINQYILENSLQNNLQYAQV